MSFTAYGYEPEKITGASADIEFKLGGIKGASVGGKFTKMRLEVSKNYDEVNLWLGK